MKLLTHPSRLGLPLLLATLLVSGCTTQTTESLDPKVNYAREFSAMPPPPAEVIHSRFQLQDRSVLGYHFPPRNGEWEFELIATPAWVDALRKGFTPLEWPDVKLRPDLPAWFSPDREKFSAFYLEGTSGIPAAHLFIEAAPQNPDQVRVFVCRH